jgi:hypothetical protein
MGMASRIACKWTVQELGMEYTTNPSMPPLEHQKLVQKGYPTIYIQPGPSSAPETSLLDPNGIDTYP